ncbi:hypothetical protein D9611_004364 [Ephemerocybe angulata]|uniref:NYN domain-containing protein n=1 Tax=Ephemerocybe angulata TaxID=980116 RepID=A0A8H5F628_9AGAR|nr:hypothetical protein D9611_004364 [Tulosesus angulatus]
MGAEPPVVVFWDASATVAHTNSGFDAARAVYGAAGSLGEVRSVKYYTDVAHGGQPSSFKLRSELKCAGVTVIDTASCSSIGGSPTKMAMTDAFIYALDNPAPRTIVFVSADPDLCYGISLLRLRGYHVYLLSPRNCGIDPQEFGLPGDFDGSTLEYGPGSNHPWNGPSHGSSPPHPQRHPSPPSGPHSFSPDKQPLRRASVNGRTNTEGTPNVLPSHEIDEFRQRFTSSRPSLDTAFTSSFRPYHRQSISSSGYPKTGPNSLPPTVSQDQPHPDKGKSKAHTTSDRTPHGLNCVGSPALYSATTISSRSNSYGHDSNSYMLPSVSTAPTSAVPFYRSDDSKFGGDAKYQSILHSALVASPRQLGATPGLGARTPSVASSNGSQGGTVIAAPTPVRAANFELPPVRDETSTSPEFDDPGLAGVGVRPPTLSPERIQVRPSRPATPQAQGRSPPSRNSGSANVVTSPHRSGSAAAGGMGYARTAAPVPSRAISTPVASTSAPPAVAAPTISAYTPPYPPLPGVAPHFLALVYILRQRHNRGAKAYARTALCNDLLKQDPEVLVAAGTAGYKNPFVAYFEEAFKEGIILNEKGAVALGWKYR